LYGLLSIRSRPEFILLQVTHSRGFVVEIPFVEGLRLHGGHNFIDWLWWIGRDRGWWWAWGTGADAWTPARIE
jgi:hypothetical protein